MSDQDMITAIVSAIQTDANLITLIRSAITMNLQIQPTIRLQAICTLLGINTNPGP